MADSANRKHCKSEFLHRSMSSADEAERLLGGRHKRDSDSSSDSSRESKSPRKGRKSSKSRGRHHHHQKKKKKNKEKRQKKSKQKKLSKGLSPPKESPKRKTGDFSKSDSVAGTFDLTQWERTRWGNLYSSECPTTGGQRRRKTGPITKTTGPGKDYEAVGSGVPGEGRQLEQVRGEHLKNRPKLQLIVLAVEGGFCAVTMSVWGGAADNPFLPFLLTLINLLFVFSLICAVFAVELCRFQVKKVETNKEVVTKTKYTTKYQVPYRWRFWLLGCHVARAILLCACITIMALDNDFDGGSIAVLALQPFHLLVVAVQVFIILRPKRKE